MTFDPSQHTKEFKKTAALLRVDLVPYQARHFGPAIDQHKLRSQDEVQKKGRSATFNGTQRYGIHARLVADLEELPRSILTHCSAGEERARDVRLDERLPPCGR